MAKDAHYTTGLKNLDLLFENGGATEQEILQRKVLLAIKHQQFDDAIKYGSQDRSPTKDVLYLIGFAYAKNKQMEAALGIFKRVQAIDPNYKKTNDYVDKLQTSLDKTQTPESKSEQDDEAEQERSTEPSTEPPPEPPPESKEENKEPEPAEEATASPSKSKQEESPPAKSTTADTASSPPPAKRYENNAPLIISKRRNAQRTGTSRSRGMINRSQGATNTPNASQRIKYKINADSEIKKLESQSTSKTINLQNASKSFDSTKQTLADLYGLTDEKQSGKTLFISFLKFLAFIIAAGAIFYISLFLDTL